MVLSKHQNMPYLDPLTREVAALIRECDRVDAMPNNTQREQALIDLISRVELFESTVPATIKRSILREVVKAL